MNPISSNNQIRPPKVSVVMPVYNVALFVEDAIQSVLDQSFENFELIIINDYSKDNSLALCQRYNDARIKIISHQHNQGLSSARNTGIRHALGQYVAFIDSDDMWHKEKLERHVQHLDGAPEVGISFSRSVFMSYAGKVLNIYQMPQLNGITAVDLLCRNPVGNGSAPVIRSETLADISYQASNKRQKHTCYFDENFRQSEDIECWLRIVTTTHWQIEGLPAPLTFYRLNNQGLSSDLSKQYGSWNKMIEKAKSFAPELLAQHENRARAYQLRYIARQAIRNKEGKQAIKHLHQALATSPSIIYFETARTVSTAAAAYLLALLPKRLYCCCENLAQNVLGRLQSLKISRDGVSAVWLNEAK
ncbi:hypothetical protein TUM4438_42350 [Shewanella sairae]|uniref:Glycosyltransferase 2-like domain-containing protein n=1 Tax=Shewanella sairae TaxID=190310 RepID=A0ABQ4PR50_9GAMM|nr:glycosyltransferase family 2 protein [Shewanella sairae]MCL1131399.1 glycosyltransferase [Shewanella sairae]GIU51727.1 hypothetical protein TUM4438_42350 [Shewanella sairae]